ncbi:MAG: hypothetical protein ACKV22_19735 [Bryobacteraceae bacterium]
MSQQARITKSTIEGHIGCPIPGEIWRFALRERMVGEANEESSPKSRVDRVQWLSDKITTMMGFGAERSAGSPVGPFVTQTRQGRANGARLRTMVVSQIVANIARRRGDLTGFRTRFFPNGLLLWKDVPAWVDARKDDATYPHAIIIRLPAGRFPEYTPEGYTFDHPEDLLRFPIEGTAPVDCLHYCGPSDTYALACPVGRDGVLRELYRLSQRLAESFGWQDSQATVFILTDLIPEIGVMKVTFQPPPWMDDAGWLQVRTRVTYELDPIGVIPSDLERSYRKVRKRLLSGRHRSLGEKNMRLAAFCSGFDRPNKAAMNKWNQEFPQWSYERVSIFARDAKAARERLLHEPAFHGKSLNELIGP